VLNVHWGVYASAKNWKATLHIAAAE